MARKSNAQRHHDKRREAEAKRRRESRNKKLRTFGVGGVAVVLLALLLVATWPEPAVGNTSADAWDLPQLDGEGRVRLADFQGKPTVAAFFASWCTVCEDEIPELLALSRELEGQVNFVGINSQDNGRGLGDAEKWGIAGEWPLATDIGNGNGSALSVQTFGARGSPTNVIYDASGQMVHVELGGVTPQRLLTLLDQLTEYET
jgi:thiol-disulfide isomerase/thioredoxin